MEDLFEKATRNQIRFQTSKGTITTEDLWDLSLESLNTIALKLQKEVKESEEGSFITKRSTVNKELALKFEVVKYIIDVKLKEKEEKLLKAEKAEKRARLLELIASKEEDSLKAKTMDELKKELEALEA